MVSGPQLEKSCLGKSNPSSLHATLRCFHSCPPLIVSSNISQRMFCRAPILKAESLKVVPCGRIYLEYSIHLSERKILTVMLRF